MMQKKPEFVGGIEPCLQCQSTWETIYRSLSGKDRQQAVRDLIAWNLNPEGHIEAAALTPDCVEQLKAELLKEHLKR